MRPLEVAEVETGKGIVGDRYHGSKHRHVTVQSAASLAEATAAFGSEIPAALTRRNLTVDSGVVPRSDGKTQASGPLPGTISSHCRSQTTNPSPSAASLRDLNDFGESNSPR